MVEWDWHLDGTSENVPFATICTFHGTFPHIRTHSVIMSISLFIKQILQNIVEILGKLPAYMSNILCSSPRGSREGFSPALPGQFLGAGARLAPAGGSFFICAVPYLILRFYRFCARTGCMMEEVAILACYIRAF